MVFSIDSVIIQWQIISVYDWNASDWTFKCTIQTQHDVSLAQQNMQTTNFKMISTNSALCSNVLPMCRIWESGNLKTNGMFTILTSMMQTCMEYAKRIHVCQRKRCKVECESYAIHYFVCICCCFVPIFTLSVYTNFVSADCDAMNSSKWSIQFQKHRARHVPPDQERFRWFSYKKHPSPILFIQTAIGFQ